MRLHRFRRPVGKFHLLGFLSLLGVLGLMFAVWFVPLASAHNSLIAASLGCSGSVSYTATAWAGPTTASRTNNDVRVFQSTDNGATWVQVGQGQFKQANGFSFSGTFSAGSAQSVRVKVQEFANWGDGVHPGPPGYATATRPADCTPTTTTTTTPTTTGTTTTTPTTPITTTTTTTAPRTPPTPPAPPAPPTTPAPPPTTTSTTTPAPPAAAPAIAIAKTERIGATGTYRLGPIGIAIGQTLDYRIVVTNTGNEALTVTVTDRLCDTGTLHARSSTTLAPSGSVTYVCSHRLAATDASPFVNTAAATAVTVSGIAVGPVSSKVVANRLSAVLGASFRKVTARAKPAKPVVAAARFTG